MKGLRWGAAGRDDLTPYIAVTYNYFDKIIF